MVETAQIAVIGGGASGMLAAIAAAEQLQKQKHPAKVVLLEKEPRIGKKLLATGNGRCNLSNLGVSPSCYHGDTAWAADLLTRYSAKGIIQRFEKMGLLCRADAEGRVYPYNLQASAILGILRLHLERLGVEIRCDFAVRYLHKKEEGFEIRSESGALFCAKRVILAAGGRAAPKLGSNGSGTRLAKQMGHTIIEEMPALVQLTTEPSLVRSIKGMRSQAVVTLLEQNGTICRKETGEVQFTEHGLSGICVFQLSGAANALLRKNVPVFLSLDLMPEWNVEQLTKKIAGQGKRFWNLPTIDLLCGFLNQRVGQAVVKDALGKEIPQKAGDCSYQQFEKIAKTVKDFVFPITGNMGWDGAQVTAGGVSCREIDAWTMESKRQKGLYFAGELIDLYGDCGGFNLHWAWISGITAGENCALAWMKG